MLASERSSPRMSDVAARAGVSPQTVSRVVVADLRYYGPSSTVIGIESAPRAAGCNTILASLPDVTADAVEGALEHVMSAGAEARWAGSGARSSTRCLAGRTRRLARRSARPSRALTCAFTVAMLSNFAPREWTPQEWADMANVRRAARVAGKAAPLPAKIDALLQLEAADQMEAEGRHDEALTFAANAVEEWPGSPQLLDWEARLVAGDHDALFDCDAFLFDRPTAEEGAEPGTDEDIVQDAGQTPENGGSEDGAPPDVTRGGDGDAPRRSSETQLP